MKSEPACENNHFSVVLSKTSTLALTLKIDQSVFDSFKLANFHVIFQL